MTLTQVPNRTGLYWKLSIMEKRAQIISPILINSKLISKFKEKANHFNAFFSSQCTPISNYSMLQLVIIPANASLSSVLFKDKDILKTIHSLSINKAHGYDDISIRLLKICDSSIVRPLSIIFKNCLQSGTFPSNWKKSNVVSVHNIREVISNFCRAISHSLSEG